MSYRPPKEQSGAGADLAATVIMMVSSTVAQIYGDEIKAAVRKLNARFLHAKLTDEQGKEI